MGTPDPAPAAGPLPAAGYRFREDVAIADAAFEAWAPTLEQLFAVAADAALATMVDDPAAVRDRECRAIRAEEQREDLLLFRLLEELIYRKDAELLLLRVRGARIRRTDQGLALEAEACGEPIDPGRHRLLTDVKAVTLHRLRVEQAPRGWEAFVVLDV